MKLQPNHSDQTYQELINRVGDLLNHGRQAAYQTVNSILLKTYWEIGRHIVEYEQHGSEKAEYGSYLLDRLSNDLSKAYGKGFSRSNLIYIRKLYMNYPIGQTLSDQLNWSHYCELLAIEDELERSFYEKQTIRERWSVRELKRQKKSALFLRLALSKDKAGILQLAKEGQVVEKPADLIREPYILEFLKIPEPYHLSETELEKRLIEHLQHFLLELGKGFAFIGRQYRITLGNRHHYVDLVFYHRILKCFVLIDLKTEEAAYADVGQMNMYLGYFEKEENTTGDNPPIGIVLAREKDDILISYALHGITSQLFISKYQVYLPNEAELRAEVERIYFEE
ncbi:MAG: DUF1016 domain-containing protein [Bacteroidetes bacterium]|nr:DUF1016 domain-containing protein [Bacteroidota bacterium]